MPSGRPSTCASCARSPGTRYVARSRPIDGSPTARRLILAAADGVALDERRRDAEHVGVVVEARRRIVWRQHRAHVHVERQQIANGVGVLGAVEPMQRRRARIGVPRRRAIELRLERRRERRRAPPAAGFGAPSGGIMPVRSLRTTFSHMSMLAVDRATDRAPASDEAAALRAVVVTAGAGTA